MACSLIYMKGGACLCCQHFFDLQVKRLGPSFGGEAEVSSLYQKRLEANLNISDICKKKTVQRIPAKRLLDHFVFFLVSFNAENQSDTEHIQQK